jgi:hypothetical protein
VLVGHYHRQSPRVLDRSLSHIADAAKGSVPEVSLRLSLRPESIVRLNISKFKTIQEQIYKIIDIR